MCNLFVELIIMLADFVQRWRLLSRGSSADRLQDIQALAHLAPLITRYLPWTGSSIRPSALLLLANEVLLNQRRTIVECGGGISTLLLARILRQAGGGTLLTIEHDQQWANILERLLKDDGLDSCCKVIWAPLENTQEAIEGCKWYSMNVLDAVVQDLCIDMLLVDGPPAYRRDIRFARYPAVPFFSKFLSDRYLVALDDIHRPGERDILARWSNLLAVPSEFRPEYGGLGLIRIGEAYTV